MKKKKILKVGDVIEFDSKKYRAVSQVEDSCRGCAFWDASDCPCCGSGDCDAEKFIFKELAVK